MQRPIRDLAAARRRESDAGRKARAARVASLRREIDNLTDAIATGGLRSSPALAARLAKAEADLVAVERETAIGDAELRKVVDLLPQAIAAYRRPR